MYLAEHKTTTGALRAIDPVEGFLHNDDPGLYKIARIILLRHSIFEL